MAMIITGGLAASWKVIHQAMKYGNKKIATLQNRLFRSLHLKTKSLYFAIFIVLITSLVCFSLFLAQDRGILKLSLTIKVILYIFLMMISVQLIILLKDKENFGNLLPKSNDKASSLRLIVMSGIGAFCIYIGTSFWAYGSGYTSGCERLFGGSSLLTIYSSHEFPLEKGQENSAQQGYEYPGYYGVIGKDYFILYKDINTTIHKPEKFYYLQKSEVMGFSLTVPQRSTSELVNIRNQCQILAEKLFTGRSIYK